MISYHKCGMYPDAYTSCVFSKIKKQNQKRPYMVNKVISLQLHVTADKLPYGPHMAFIPSMKKKTKQQLHFWLKFYVLNEFLS